MSRETQSAPKGGAPKATFGALARLATAINRYLAIAAGAVIVGIAVLIVANVLLRYFTGQAIIGAEEIRFKSGNGSATVEVSTMSGTINLEK